MFENQTALYMIEGGRALDLARTHVAEVMRVRDENFALAEELGNVHEIWTHSLNGAITGVVFKGLKPHSDFTKPRSATGHGRVSYPKKGSKWAKRFGAINGYHPPSDLIADEFRIPLSIAYQCKGGRGARCVGSPFTPCGFLYLSENGPFAMWVPDVPAEVAKEIAKGHTVDEPAASYKMQFEMCHRIELEEWEILVAKHKLAKKRERDAASAHNEAQPA